MRLSDIMSAAGLTSWAEIGLIISVVAFAAIVVYTFVIRSRGSWEEARRLPLEADTGARLDSKLPGGER